MQGRLTIAWLLILLCLQNVQAQFIEIDTNFPRADQPFTFTVDVNGTSLAGYEGEVWLWAWIENGDQDIDAPTNVNPATDAQDAAKMTRSATNPNAYSITITPTIFFNRPAGEINEIGLKLKSRDWNDNKQSDQNLYIQIFQEGFQIKLLAPSADNITAVANERIPVESITSDIADSIEVTIGNELVLEVYDVDILASAITSASPGNQTVEIAAYKDGIKKAEFFNLLILAQGDQQPLPVGMVEGINYLNDNEVILALKAPQKESVYVVGDFNNWTYDPAYQMNLDSDGETFWIKISNLNPGQEYGFQYVVDGSIYIADPYADKILDPDDQWIPEAIYPNLKNYPGAALRNQWYHNRVSVLQTGQSPFNWQVSEFQTPAAEDLVIYELLIRDFFAENDRSFQNLIDTLNYLENLGINAIQLMPITEFNGNNSWGYNPTFMFAVDKAYGPKNDLKKFIDAAHQRGIAVILDMVLNHQDIPNPLALMYWAGDRPSADNPWFNQSPTHPFNVFSDMNHESLYTQDYVDTVNHYWLNEYKFDGYRYDLSKGFTQKNTGSDVNAWTAYDASRVALLKRMADQLWSHSPDAYIILEHFGDDQEEKELSDYGMMLWGNMNHVYSDANMARNANLSRTYFQNRGWDKNLLVSYLESHDEERVMYRTLNNGLSNGAYDTKNLDVALERLKMSHAFLLLVPGPKMIWQFGELGYDISINQCEDGSMNSNCNIAPKPLKWDYYDQENRKKVYDVIAELNQLRQTDAFKNGNFSWQSFERVKWIKIEHSAQNMLAIGNFNTFPESYTFAEGGTWYDYFTGNELKIPNGGFEYQLEPGQFHIFVSEPPSDIPADLVPWTTPVITSLENELGQGLQLFPNPVKDFLTIKLSDYSAGDISLRDITGKQIATADYRLMRTIHQVKVDMSRMSNGLYLLEVMGDRKRTIYKVIKR